MLRSSTAISALPELFLYLTLLLSVDAQPPQPPPPPLSNQQVPPGGYAQQRPLPINPLQLNPLNSPRPQQPNPYGGHPMGGQPSPVQPHRPPPINPLQLNSPSNNPQGYSPQIPSSSLQQQPNYRGGAQFGQSHVRLPDNTPNRLNAMATPNSPGGILKNNPPSHPGQQFTYQSNAQQYNSALYQQRSRQWGQVLQKGFLTNPQRSTKLGFEPSAASFELRFLSYSNPSLSMSDQMTCICPQGRECPYLKMLAFPCMFSFTTIVTSADSVIYYHSTDFIPINTTGQLVAGYGSSDQYDFGIPLKLDLSTKPQSVDIFVHNLGPVIKQMDAQPLYFDYLYQVDTFVLDLRGYTPLGASEQPRMEGSSYTGQLVGSNLQLSYSVQCKPGYVGSMCELRCATVPYSYSQQQGSSPSNQQIGNSPPSSYNQQPPPSNQGGVGGQWNQNPTGQQSPQQQSQYQPQQSQRQQEEQSGPTVICESRISNVSQQCTYTDLRRTQVRDCIYCQYGIVNNTCMTSSAAWWALEPGVSSVFQTLTIILGILLGLILLILIVICVFILIATKKAKGGRRPVYNRVKPPSSHQPPRPAIAHVTNPLIRDYPSSQPRNGSSMTSDEWSKPAITALQPRPQPVPIALPPIASGSENDYVRALPRASQPQQQPPRREAQV